MLIPYTRLSKQALRGVIQEFISREGTFYGQGEALNMEALIQQVEQKLEDKLAFITWNEEENTPHIISKKTLEDHEKESEENDRHWEED